MSDEQHFPPQTLSDWLADKPFTLTLSSGFFGFFAHCGVLAALHKAGHRPARLTGSSAGALIASCYAAGLSPDTIAERLFALERQAFWDPWPGMGLLRGRKFRRLLADILPVQSFEDCQTPLAVTAFDGVSRSAVVLSKGELIPAVYASCAVPFLFQPIWLNWRPHWDGGVVDRPGMAGTRPGERIFYHHIASRSPWRSRSSLALRIPARAHMRALAISNLPRSGPSKMHLGPRIFQLAYDAAEQALTRRDTHIEITSRN